MWTHACSTSIWPVSAYVSIRQHTSAYVSIRAQKADTCLQHFDLARLLACGGVHKELIVSIPPASKACQQLVKHVSSFLSPAEVSIENSSLVIRQPMSDAATDSTTGL